MAERSPDALFQETRAILQGDKTPKNWKRLLKLLDDAAIDTPHFRHEFEPAILSSLDRDWPDTLRVVSYDAPARVRKYARIYCVETGFRHSGTYFKKTVKEMAADIKKGVPRGHYSGLYFHRITGLPNLMFEELVETGKVGPLEHFYADGIGQSSTYARYNGPEDQIGAMLDALLDRDAANLRGVSLSMWMGQCHEMWDALLARRGELTSLEGIIIEVDELHRIMGALEPLELKWLSVTGYYTLDWLDDVFAHPFTSHLESFKCRWHEGQLDFPRWVAKGLAPSVLHWCVTDEYDYMYESLWFDMAKAMYWRDRLGGKKEHLLDARVARLPEVDHEAARVHLFEGDRLIPSERLEALSVGPLDHEDACALIEQAPHAWPNLKTLILSNVFEYGTPAWDLLEEAELLDRLEYFSWGTRWSSVKEIGDAIRSARRSVVAYRQAVGPFVDEILEDRWRPVLNYEVGSSLVRHTSNKPQARALAKMLGIAIDDGMDTRDVRAKIIVFLRERFERFEGQASPFVHDSPDFDALRRSGLY